jgi:hypothetical protein
MIFSGDASAGNLSIGMHNSNHASYPNQAWIWASGSTTPLVLATQGTARATIDSTGKLGINTQVPKSLLHVATSNASDTPTLGTATGGVFVTNANVNYGLHIGSQSTGNSWLQVTRNDSTATAYNLHLQPVGGVVAIGTSTADSLYNLTIQRFSGSSGNIMLQGDNVTIGLPNIVFKNTNGGATAYLGFNGDAVTAKAIAFPATQVASSDPNTLDDYEEGTWTPAIIGTITNPVYSTSNITAKYTKIGRIVHFQFLIVVNGVTSQGSGNIQISGLPFGSTGNSYEHVVQIGYNDVWDTNFISGYVSGSYIVVIPATVTQSNAVWGAASATSSNLSTGYFAISGTYVTTT